MCFWATPLDYRCRRTPYISLKKRPLAKLCTKNHKTPPQNDRKPPVRGKGELSGPNERRIWGETGANSPPARKECGTKQRLLSTQGLSQDDGMRRRHKPPTSDRRSHGNQNDITRAALGKDGQKETPGPHGCSASEHRQDAARKNRSSIPKPENNLPETAINPDSQNWSKNSYHTNDSTSDDLAEIHITPS